MERRKGEQGLCCHEGEQTEGQDVSILQQARGEHARVCVICPALSFTVMAYFLSTLGCVCSSLLATLPSLSLTRMSRPKPSFPIAALQLPKGVCTVDSSLGARCLHCSPSPLPRISLIPTVPLCPFHASVVTGFHLLFLWLQPPHVLPASSVTPALIGSPH